MVENFSKIALATEELRREFSRMRYLNKRPTEYGLRIREPRIDMMVTAMNKMRRGESVRVHFAESLVSSLDIPLKSVATNFNAFSDLICSIDSRSASRIGATHQMKSGQKGSYHHRWDEVDAFAVLEFLKIYRASSNLCFEAEEGGSSQIFRYIQSGYEKGELVKWTVALISNSQANDFSVNNCKYKCVHRKIDNRKIKTRSSQYCFKGVAMGQDEAIDLSIQEYDSAIAQSAGDNRSRAAFYRYNRPRQRGLLLLYPIIPQLDGVNLNPDHPIIGVAVSFPKSANDAGQEYVCNPRMLIEIFGEQFVEDAKRDEDEDREALTITRGGL
jgi:hypothetical protein